MGNSNSQPETNSSKECSVGINEESTKINDEIRQQMKYNQLKHTAAFYSVQSRHILANNPVEIGVYISKNVEETWIQSINRAIQIVNKTCPGIKIEIINHSNAEKQIVIQSSNKMEAYTHFNLLVYNKATITLGSEWPKDKRNGTTLHELLHALGVQHEHKRKDAHKFGITVNREKCIELYDEKEWDNKWKYQYEADNNVHGITAYDPHSIMNYVSCNGEFDIDHNSITVYSAYSPITGDKRRDVLSPIDEIGLNLLYKPCKTKTYNPRKNTKTTSLYYCNRMGATNGHNYPANDLSDGRCGPNNGPNCAACRVLQNDDIPKKNSRNDNVWQGSSGHFYCGKKIQKKGSGHDGICGPNNGPSCDSCSTLVR